jgi:protein-L-isoaspartate(D-aspartate) O-methyltransferase
MTPLDSEITKLRSQMAELKRSSLLAAVVAIVSALAVPVPSAQAQTRDPYEAARHEMVREYIEAEGIASSRVLEAMRTVPRHEFVRPSLRRAAYRDHALDIGHKQTISPPYIVAYMTETLDPQPDDRVLEIGTGSGYQAAILGKLVKEVYSIEILEPLGRQAAARLERLGYKNVYTKVDDGYVGWPEHAPFDKIIVTCSPESVPAPLIEQLREGGKLIIPLGERYQQVFHLLQKQDGKLVEQRLQPTLFVPMTGKSEDLRTVQPDGSRPEIVNAGFEQIDDPGRFAHWHYQRRAEPLTEGAAEGSQCVRFENDEPGRTAHMVQGLALDGSRVPAVTLSCQYRGERLTGGPRPHERAALQLHFYDDRRLPIGSATVGPWLVDTESWVTASGRINVPSRCREAILQIGLNGATGVLDVDDIRITSHSR